MVCPRCGQPSRVIFTRRWRREEVRRDRQCLRCKLRFFTTERLL